MRTGPRGGGIIHLVLAGMMAHSVTSGMCKAWIGNGLSKSRVKGGLGGFPQDRFLYYNVVHAGKTRLSTLPIEPGWAVLAEWEQRGTEMVLLWSTGIQLCETSVGAIKMPSSSPFPFPSSPSAVSLAEEKPNNVRLCSLASRLQFPFRGCKLENGRF